MSAFKKLDHVDALRGLAILAVVLVHCAQHGTNEYPSVIDNIFSRGAMGVQLFYVMSAFTLFLSCDRRWDLERYPNLNFFIRRVFRIAPMYYIGILYYLWQNGRGPNFWTGGEVGITDGNIVANFLFVHGFNPFWINSLVPGGWSISVEMVFYLLVPFFFKWIKNMDQALKFFLLTLGIRLVLHAFFIKFPMIENPGLWREFLFLYLPNQIPVFIIGFMLYFLLRGNKEDRKINPWYLLVLGLTFIAHLATGREVIIPTHVMFGFGFLLLAWTLAHKQFKLIVNPLIRHIGKVSYSMYLCHFAVLYWIEHFGFADIIVPTSLATGLVNYAIRYLIVVAIAVPISTFFYKFVEMPVMGIGKKLIKSWEAKPVAAEVRSGR